MENFAESLKLLQKNVERLLSDRGWSQTQLAEHIGIKQSQLNKWLTGKQTPGIDKLDKLAKGLGVSVEKLLSAGDAPAVFIRDLGPEEILEKLRDALGLKAFVDRAKQSDGNKPSGIALVPHEMSGIDLRHIPIVVLQALAEADETAIGLFVPSARAVLAENARLRNAKPSQKGK